MFYAHAQRKTLYLDYRHESWREWGGWSVRRGIQFPFRVYLIFDPIFMTCTTDNIRGTYKLLLESSNCWNQVGWNQVTNGINFFLGIKLVLGSSYCWDQVCWNQVSSHELSLSQGKFGIYDTWGWESMIVSTLSVNNQKPSFT